MTAVVIADIIGSRRLSDRDQAQRALDEAIARVERDLPLARARLQPTVGDEQQGVYPSLEAALASLLLLQLALPEGLRCRFGVGLGEVRTISSAGREIAEGPGWWAARDAIDIVHAKQQRSAPAARTWIVAAPDQDEGVRAALPSANAYVLARDQIVAIMSDRARRLTYGRCLGRSQRQLAEVEGITQPAVSQALAAAGAGAIVEGFLALGVGGPA